MSLKTRSGPDKNRTNWLSILKFQGVERGKLKISETDIEVLELKANSVFNCFIEAVGECCEYYYIESSYLRLSDTFLETVTKASAANIIDANG